MHDIMKTTLFKATSSRAEAKLDATGRIARAIIEQNAAVRIGNMERLRAARIARDAAVPEAVADVRSALQRPKTTTS